MFDDGRSKKIVFIAHCFLNQNSISDGTAVCPAGFKEIVNYFLDADIGVIQMPCPELSCLGLDRGNVYGAESPVVIENTRIRSEMQKNILNAKLDMLVDFVIQQISEYNRHGFAVVGIIGANRSPNCGVDTTSDNNMEVEGMGLFIEKISKELIRKNFSVPIIGLKSTDDVIGKLNQLISF